MKHPPILRLLATLLLALTATAASAYDFYVDGIYYNYNYDYNRIGRNVSVTYDDRMSHPYSGKVIIPSQVKYGSSTYTVSKIGDEAFSGCRGLTKITIPNSVTSIGSSAFLGCRGLTSVTIPNSVTEIGDRAFSGCSGLTSVTIPNSVTSIGDGAFYGIRLTSVTIPYSVTSIGVDAFDHSELNHIVVESFNSTYDSRNGCNAIIETSTNKLICGCKNTIIPNSVTSIGDGAFSNCSGLISVAIPKSVTSIGASAFANCSSLKSVVLGAGLTSINSSAFSGCSIKKLFWLPNTPPSGCNSVKASVHYVANDQYSFSNQTKYQFLSSMFTVDGTVYVPVSPSERTCDVIDCTYSPDDKNITIAEKVSNKGVSLTILTVKPYSHIGNPYIESVSISHNGAIGNYAFQNCTALQSASVSNSGMVGEYAFDGCTSLQELTLNNLGDVLQYAFQNTGGIEKLTITNKGNLGESVFKGSQLQNVVIINEGYVGISAFSGCTALQTATISNQGDIGNYAFLYCTALQTATISNHGAVGTSAFNGCTSLTSATLGSAVTSIGESAFEQCSSLAEFIIPNNVLSIGASAFYYCTSLQTVSIGTGVKTIPQYAFRYCSKLNKFVIPDNVTTISSYAFHGCSSLAVLTFNDGATPLKLDSNDSSPLFSSCKLGKVYVGRKLSYSTSADAGYSPFYNNKYLSNIEFGEAETNIYDNEFSGCSNLSWVKLGNKTDAIGQKAFYGCSNLSEIIIPNSVSDIGVSAFENCSSLWKVTIGSGVASLEQRVFYGCSSLPSLTIPSNVASVGNYAFGGCISLSDLTIQDGNSTLKLGSNGSSPLFVDCPLDEVYIGRKLSYSTASSAGYSPFYRNTSLRAVEITDAETQIYDNEFYGCTNLQTLKIGNGVKTIGKWAFSGCSSMEYFSAGYNVESLGQESFSDCTGLTSYYSYSVVPPTCGTQALDDINKWECKLYVPESSTDEYMAAAQWNDFFFVDVIKDAPAIEIELNATSLNLTVDSTYQLTATVKSNNESNALVWASSNPEIATVDQTGLVTAIAEGTATVTVTCGAASASCNITVSPKEIEEGSITVNPTSITLSVDGSEQITATINIEGATIDDIVWSSSNPEIATVEQTGLVTAIAEGSATITATCGTYSASCAVVVVAAEYVEVTGIVLNSTDVYLAETETFQFIAEVQPSNATNKTITWESLDPEIASVDNTGLVTAHKRGSTTILAKSESAGLFASSFLTVTGPIDQEARKFCVDGIYYSINDDNTSVSVTSGDSKYLGSITIPSQVTYNGATYSVTSIGVDAFHGCTDLTSVTIPNSVTSIGEKAFLYTGLTSVTIPNSVTEIGEWAFSECEDLASVAISESITSIKPHTFAFCYCLTSITIPNSVTEIGSRAFVYCNTLESFSAGYGVQKIASDAFNMCNSLTSYYSHSIVPPTCDNNELNDINKATCTLYVPALCGDAYRATAPWSEFSTIIEMDAVLVAEILLNCNEFVLSSGDTFQLTAEVLPVNVTDPSVVWSSSNPEVATVDDNGLVTAVYEGTATITATSADGNAMATADVEVKINTGIEDVTVDGSADIEVYNAAGVKIGTSLHNLVPGVYFVRQGTKVTKVVVK